MASLYPAAGTAVCISLTSQISMILSCTTSATTLATNCYGSITELRGKMLTWMETWTLSRAECHVRLVGVLTSGLHQYSHKKNTRVSFVFLCASINTTDYKWDVLSHSKQLSSLQIADILSHSKQVLMLQIINILSHKQLLMLQITDILSHSKLLLIQERPLRQRKTPPTSFLLWHLD